MIKLTRSTLARLEHGLYRIYWKDGGHSLASVGSVHSGVRWYSPTNWTSKDGDRPLVASTDWGPVKCVDPISPHKAIEIPRTKDDVGRDLLDKLIGKASSTDELESMTSLIKEAKEVFSDGDD